MLTYSAQDKIYHVEDEDKTRDTEELLKQDISMCNLGWVCQLNSVLIYKLGMNKYDRWFDMVLENVRKDEICLVTLKYISKVPNTDQKTQSFKYYQVSLMDWITVIDLDQEQRYLKRVLKKGEGHTRCVDSDEIACKHTTQGEIV